jgi:hypothetical protein
MNVILASGNERGGPNEARIVRVIADVTLRYGAGARKSVFLGV